MTLNEFITKYNGKYLEVAGSSAQNQCVDLANAYLRDVLNHAIVEWTNARDFPSKLTDFDWIQNTPDGVPQEGDIVVWQNNEYGHIAVFVEGSASSFRSFDQNYPTGSPCHIQNHTYITAMCWGRPKNKGVFVDDATFTNLVRKSTIYDRVVDKLQSQDNETIVLQEIDKLMGVEDAIIQKDKQLTETQLHAQELDQALKVKEGELVNLQTELKELQDKTQEALNDNKVLSEEVSKLKENVVQPVFSGWKAIVYKILQNL